MSGSLRPSNRAVRGGSAWRGGDNAIRAAGQGQLKAGRLVRAWSGRKGTGLRGE